MSWGPWDPRNNTVVSALGLYRLGVFEFVFWLPVFQPEETSNPEILTSTEKKKSQQNSACSSQRPAKGQPNKTESF